MPAVDDRLSHLSLGREHQLPVESLQRRQPHLGRGARRFRKPHHWSYRDYTRELLALSDAADAAGRTLAGALYQRSAEFSMLPHDPRKDAARHRFIVAMRAVFGSTGRPGTSSPTAAATWTPTGTPRRVPWVPS